MSASADCRMTRFASMSRGSRLSSPTERFEGNAQAPVICSLCKETYSDDDAKVMICTCFGKWVCLQCGKYTEEQYGFLSSQPELHFYCLTCTEAALSYVKNGAEIAAKCEEYFAKYSSRLAEIEEKLETKADKSANRCNWGYNTKKRAGHHCIS